MLRLRYILGIVLIGLSLNSNAQTGCLLPSNVLYTSQVPPGLLGALLGSAPYYYGTPNTPLAGPECYWSTISTTGVTCKVCPGNYTDLLGLGLLTGCDVAFVNGVQGSFVMECDIDDHAWALVLGAGAFGVYLIRRKGLI